MHIIDNWVMEESASATIFKLSLLLQVKITHVLGSRFFTYFHKRKFAIRILGSQNYNFYLDFKTFIITPGQNDTYVWGSQYLESRRKFFTAANNKSCASQDCKWIYSAMKRINIKSVLVIFVQ